MDTFASSTKNGWLTFPIVDEASLRALNEWILDELGSHFVILTLDEVMERLEQLDRPDWMQNFVELRQQLPNLRADLQERVDRLAVTAVRSGDGPQGKALFEQACMQCHQLRHKGALIGPQLDGIAQRSSLRILEDILDPNRNVDKAFQSTRLVMNDGEILSGVIREGLCKKSRHPVQKVTLQKRSNDRQRLSAFTEFRGSWDAP